MKAIYLGRSRFIASRITDEIQTGHRLRRHGLRRLAGAENRHRRAANRRDGAGKVVSQRAALAQFQPHGHRRSRAGHGGAFRNSAAPNSRCPPRKLALALNAWLPEDIRVLSAARAPEKFHARFDAAGKQYRYFVWNHAAMNPLLRHSAWQVPRPLDLQAMRAAAPLFVGRHDFKSFAASRNYEMESTVRKLTRCDIKKSGRVADVHHRRRRVSLQNVPRHRRDAGAGWPGQISAGRNQADAGEKRPARGRHDRAGAWPGVVEGVLSKSQQLVVSSH